MCALHQGNIAGIGRQRLSDREEAPEWQVMIEVEMAEINKLSVEKALEKLRNSDAPKSRNGLLDEKIGELDEEIKRMKAQRLRLDRHQQKR